jgi:hypothetical protein
VGHQDTSCQIKFQLMQLTTPTKVPAPIPGRMPNVRVNAIASGWAAASGAIVSAVTTDVIAKMSFQHGGGRASYLGIVVIFVACINVDPSR